MVGIILGEDGAVGVFNLIRAAVPS